ncbi:Hsp70 protein [Stackebrandtia albiflava]|uniref:Hsp70 protein n=1 Tax=Stackebrandtia albiflava TaxID=406432 RepID=A0A562URK2_9ACTN|nr:Hsp70 family protein [Stackebrandtia albiflava]TWJ08228.1 Hsp70 protein [Stackebrandtia albiflava]
MSSPIRLGVDFGTSHTVAVLDHGGVPVPVLFDSSPILPSAVYAEPDGELLVGFDAVNASRLEPARFEPNPKRRVDDGTVLLGDREFPVVELIAAVLGRVRRECERILGDTVVEVTLTHPAVWGSARRLTLEESAAMAGFHDVHMVPEPVAAATFFTHALRNRVATDSAVMVADLGGGTFDASVVINTTTGFRVLSVDGIENLGGVDVDHALFTLLDNRFADSPDWSRLARPSTTEDRRARRALNEDVRTAKERLTRSTRVEFPIPLVGADTHLTRDELEAVARPLMERAVRLTVGVVKAARVPPERQAGLLLVGGASRMPLVASMLHQTLGTAPTVLEQPELVVAQGATLSHRPSTTPSVAPPAAIPAQIASPVSVPLPAAAPVSPHGGAGGTASPVPHPNPPTASTTIPPHTPTPPSDSAQRHTTRPRALTAALAVMLFQTGAWALISLFGIVAVALDSDLNRNDYFTVALPVFIMVGVATGMATWQLGRSAPRRWPALVVEYGLAALCYVSTSFAIMEDDAAYPLGPTLVAVASLPAMAVVPLLHRREIRDRCPRMGSPKPDWLTFVQVVMWVQAVPSIIGAVAGLAEFAQRDADAYISPSMVSLVYGWPIYLPGAVALVIGAVSSHRRGPVNRRIALGAEYALLGQVVALVVLVSTSGTGLEDPGMWGAAAWFATSLSVIPLLHRRQAREWFGHADPHRTLRETPA